MTRGTKVVLWRQNDFNSLNNAVFFVGWAGQECPGYLFVHGVKNARATFLSPASAMPPVAAVMAHRSMPRPTLKLANGEPHRNLGHRPMDAVQRS